MKKRTTSKASKTDRKRLDGMRDEDIDLSDIPATTPEWFAKATLRWPGGSPPLKKQITLRLDADVLKWFRAQGKGYQAQINALLRSYMVSRHEKRGIRRG